MINKLYSALTESAPGTGSEYYGKHRSHVQVPRSYKDLSEALVPKGSPDAMAFRASVLIELIKQNQPIFELLEEVDPENTYRGFPKYRDTVVMCGSGYALPGVSKNADCREPFVAGKALGRSTDVFVETNITGQFTVPYDDSGTATVKLPYSYTMVLPDSWNTGGEHVIPFTITGTPAQPVWETYQVQPYATALDPDLFALVDPFVPNTLCAALGVQLARGVNG